MKCKYALEQVFDAGLYKLIGKQESLLGSYLLMKFSRAISQVKWLSGEKTNILKTFSVLVLRVLGQTSTLRTRTEMVFKTLVFSLLNHLTQLIAQENFIILSRQESNKSHLNYLLPDSFHDTSLIYVWLIYA
jgi:hypothetical protein